MKPEIQTARTAGASHFSESRTQSFHQYVDLLLRLHLAMLNRDRALANQLREEMDMPAEQISPADMDWLDGLSGDLYLLDDKEVPEQTDKSPQELMGMLQDAQARGDGEMMLWVLRRLPPISKAGIAHFRANAYHLLGCYGVALVFRIYAAKFIGKQRPDYYLLLLADLKRYGLKDDLLREALEFTNIPSAVVKVFSAVMLYSASSDLPVEEAEALARKAAEVIEEAVTMGSAQGTPERVLDRQELTLAYMTLCSIYEDMGNLPRARQAADMAVAVSPHDDAPLVIRGRLLMREDPAAAALDFQKAAGLGTQHDFPYLALAHDALLSADFRRALKMSKRAYAFASSDRVRAQATHFSAICYYELGRPIDEVLHKFDHASRLDPADTRIRDNREVVRQDAAQNQITQSKRGQAGSLFAQNISVTPPANGVLANIISAINDIAERSIETRDVRRASDSSAFALAA